MTEKSVPEAGNASVYLISFADQRSFGLILFGVNLTSVVYPFQANTVSPWVKVGVYLQSTQRKECQFDNCLGLGLYKRCNYLHRVQRTCLESVEVCIIAA